jgi:rubrerythrin
MKITLSKAQWETIGKKSGWTKKSQVFDSVKKLDALDNRELTRAIRDALIAEEQAIKQYETLADSTSNNNVKKIVQDIANEEKVHVGELQKLLSDLLPDEQKFLDKGKEEIEEKS